MVCLAALSGCEQKPPTPAPAEADMSAQPKVHEVTRQKIDLGGMDDEQLKPLYPEGVKPSADAVKLCDALWKLPRVRRAECCKGKESGVRPETRCIEVVSAAVADKSVELDPSALQACVAARAAQLQGCDWVGNLAPAAPPACQALFVGQRTAGQSCRAASECAAGLRCAGSGPMDAGTCQPPGKPGAVCNAGADVLSSVALQRARTTECEGYCARNKCREAVKPGAKCTASIQCGANAHCDTKTCRSGEAADGGSCAGGGCAGELRCVSSRCVRPAASGACANDLECVGACVEGTCGKRCQRVIAR